MSRPFTATAAVKTRMRELDITAAELADRAEVSYIAVRYLAFSPTTGRRLKACRWRLTGHPSVFLT